MCHLCNMRSCDLDFRILLSRDSSGWLIVSNSNQDCELASSVPVLFGEDVETSCNFKYVTIVTIMYLLHID